ncbi:hypothetical protein ABNF97_25055 [Plantactinospora sp. B6F1]|uniref:hypothetical protein n=1 Tax=Plantactinospora sp. B6F1 TaxID=3158971 RepID=UPI0032D954FA
MDDIEARWRADVEVERQHRGGGRCRDCAPRGGCLALLGAVRRRVDAEETGLRPTLGRLV